MRCLGQQGLSLAQQYRVIIIVPLRLSLVYIQPGTDTNPYWEMFDSLASQRGIQIGQSNVLPVKLQKHPTIFTMGLNAGEYLQESKVRTNYGLEPIATSTCTCPLSPITLIGWVGQTRVRQ
jgi:hypothetical protein